MWAQELFQSFIKKDTAKEQELINKHLPRASKHSLQSIKNVYQKRKIQGMTPFTAAILHDDMALCEQLIQEGMDFGKRASAKAFDERKFLKFNNDASELIFKGPSSNVFNDFNQTTPMFWAIKCNKISLIQKLIVGGHKMNFSVETFSGIPALSFAILSRNIEAVKYFLLNEQCNIHENSLPEMKPLDVAIRSGNTDMVEILLRHGENLNCSKHQLSPLLQAVFLNKLPMVDFILSMGADINFGMETGQSFSPLNMAVLRAHFEMAHFLIERGADVNVKDSTDNTALHMLARHFKGQPVNGITNWPAFKLAQSLIEKGARVDGINKEFESPLLQAIYLGSPELVDLYLTTPVDLNAPLIRPKATILHVAVEYPVAFGKISQYWFGPSSGKGPISKERFSIVKSLIKKGADVNKQCGEEKRTLLHFAVKCGHVKLVKLLLKSKADVNKQAADGKTALHYAVSRENSEVVKLLVTSGAKVNVKDVIGSTPLDYGIMENEGISYDTVKLLIDNGADIYSQGSHKPLGIYDIAIAMLRTDLMKLFWSQGYPYDHTVFKPVTNIVASLKSYFKNFPRNNIISIDFKKRISRTDCKEIENLMDAQSKFINGVVNNKVEQVLGAIEKGAEVRGGSVKVPFPLHFAAKNGFTDVAQVLLSKGVSANQVNSEGKTPASLAVEFGHSKTYITLLQHGATYLTDDSDLSTLIQKAFESVQQGDHQCISTILGEYVAKKDWDMYHALVNCTDKTQSTLLGWALKNGDLIVLKELTIFNVEAEEASMSP